MAIFTGLGCVNEARLGGNGIFAMAFATTMGNRKVALTSPQNPLSTLVEFRQGYSDSYWQASKAAARWQPAKINTGALSLA